MYRCVPDPAGLADLIGSRRRHPSTAAAIRVYRGRLDPNHQPTVTASNDAQSSAWTRDQRVQVIRRQLNYRDWPRLPPQEKGIDVAIAVDLMHLASVGSTTRSCCSPATRTCSRLRLPVLAGDGTGHRLGSVKVSCCG